MPLGAWSAASTHLLDLSKHKTPSRLVGCCVVLGWAGSDCFIWRRWGVSSHAKESRRGSTLWGCQSRLRFWRPRGWNGRGQGRIRTRKLYRLRWVQQFVTWDVKWGAGTWELRSRVPSPTVCHVFVCVFLAIPLHIVVYFAGVLSILYGAFFGIYKIGYESSTTRSRGIVWTIHSLGTIFRR